MRVVAAGRTAGVVLLLAGSALLAACGGGGEAKDSEGAKSGGGSGAVTEGPVAVALSEWTLKPSNAAAKAGKVTFKTTNNGTTPHELTIVKTDVAHDKLQQAEGIADEAKYKPLGRTKQLNGSQSEDLAVDLTPGKYVLLCNVSGHYALGMHAAFTVN